MSSKHARFDSLATTVTRSPAGATFATAVTARGAVKIDGATWPFFCGAHYVLATRRAVIPMHGRGPSFATEAMRATAQALLNAPVTVVVTATGSVLRTLAKLAENVALEHGANACPMSAGGAEFNMVELATPALIARDDERVVIARAGDVLRVDGDSFRFALMRLDDGAEALYELMAPSNTAVGGDA